MERTSIEVQFRMLNGEVIAVFPYEIEGRNTVSSYMHVGQHSACLWDINHFTKPATPEQYKELAKELTNLGYDLTIITRRNHAKYLAEWKKVYLPKSQK
jgi:hypothetical protein